jgi:hypothetical protein
MKTIDYPLNLFSPSNMLAHHQKRVKKIKKSLHEILYICKTCKENS